MWCDWSSELFSILLHNELTAMQVFNVHPLIKTLVGLTTYEFGFTS